MAQETVLIGCRLPHGLTLTLREPMTPEGKPGAIIERVTIKGLKDSKIIGAQHVTTPVNAEFWATWKKTYTKFQPLRNGSIFEASNEAHAEQKAKQLAKQKTGFEPLAQDAAGVKPAAKD